jgi:nicotinamide riboside transporter PnuC
MPRTALVLFVVYLTLAFGWRSWSHWRRTGSAGYRGVSGAPGSAEWLGGVLFVVALVNVALAPAAQWLGWLAPVSWLDRRAAHAGGLLLAGAGIAATVWSQPVWTRPSTPG